MFINNMRFLGAYLCKSLTYTHTQAKWGEEEDQWKKQNIGGVNKENNE